MERFLAAAWISGIKPVVVLTKADTVSSTLPYEEATLDIALDTSVVAVNAHDTDTTGALAPFLKPGRTSTMIGLSGAGKSTLTNTLAGNHVMTTRSVRAFDDKGRHTTTHRQLVRLPKERGLLIDSPGVREMQVWNDPAIASRVFCEDQRRSSSPVNLATANTTRNNGAQSNVRRMKMTTSTSFEK